MQTIRKRRLARTAPLALLFAALLGCDPKQDDGIEGLGNADGGGNGGKLDAAAGLDPAGFAVVASDYTVTSVALLGLDGSLRKRDFVDSGSATAGLVTAFSGDVVLPTRSGERGVLTLIDRLRTNVITRIDVVSGEVLDQIKTQARNAQDDKNSYSSNPQDYVRIDADSAWVSRYEPNVNAADDDPDKGLDLLRIDLARGAPSTERIDFSAFDASTERTNPDTKKTEQVQVYARPGRIVRLGDDLLAVGVDSLSQTFDAAGKGMVALVDLERNSVKMLELPGLLSCGQVVPVPDDETRVAVACTGVYFDEDQREHAGLAMLVLRDGSLEIEHVWRAKDDADAALTRYGLMALSATEVLAAAAGAMAVRDDAGKVLSAATNDALYRVDLVSGTQRAVLEAGGQFVIGDGAYDARSGLLLVPDASADAKGKPTAGVRRLQRNDAGEFEAIDVIAIDAILPVRQVALLD